MPSEYAPCPVRASYEPLDVIGAGLSQGHLAAVRGRHGEVRQFGQTGPVARDQVERRKAIACREELPASVAAPCSRRRWTIWR